MTVCIAAVRKNTIDAEATIIMCSDLKISSVLGSAETALKEKWLGGSWNCLMAGTNADMHAIYRSLSLKFAETEATTGIDETNAGKVVRDVLAAHKKQKVNDLVYGQYAISYDDLLSIGKEKLPPELFREAIVQVRDTPIDAEFIIAGFAGNFPIIFQTDRTGRVFIREDFAVIGEGGYLAQSVLLHREHSDVKLLPRSLYAVYEAKKYAEGVASVGKFSWITIIHSDGRKQRPTLEGLAFLEQQYALLGPKSIPPDLKLTDDMVFTD